MQKISLECRPLDFYYLNQVKSQVFFDTEITRAPGLAEVAYQNNSAARLLLVKRAIDYVINEGGVVATITKPDVPALEAIGGTGDTITGLVAAFTYAELEPHQAAIITARANRMAGQFAEVTNERS